MSMLYYPVPLYEQQTHANLDCKASNFPICEQTKTQVLSLPMFPELTDAEQQTVVEGIQTALTKTATLSAV